MANDAFLRRRDAEKGIAARRRKIIVCIRSFGQSLYPPAGYAIYIKRAHALLQFVYNTYYIFDILYAEFIDSSRSSAKKFSPETCRKLRKNIVMFLHSFKEKRPADRIASISIPVCGAFSAPLFIPP